jgi:hypothetical protein
VDHKLTEGIIFTIQFPMATVKKNTLYVREPNNIEDLKKRIKHEIRQITPEMLQNVRDACYYRFAISQERDTRCPLTCCGFFFFTKIAYVQVMIIPDKVCTSRLYVPKCYK